MQKHAHINTHMHTHTQIITHLYNYLYVSMLWNVLIINEKVWWLELYPISLCACFLCLMNWILLLVHLFEDKLTFYETLRKKCMNFWKESIISSYKKIVLKYVCLVNSVPEAFFALISNLQLNLEKIYTCLYCQFHVKKLDC